MRNIAFLLTATILATPAAAQGLDDQISQLFQVDGAGCNEGVANQLTTAIRSGIEAEVKRAEAALQLPAPIADMGCLDNLLDINLDTLIKVPSVQGMIDSVISEGENRLCSFAQEQFAKVTEPLNAALTLPSFENLEIPGFESQSMTIEFDGPSVGFGSEGQVSINPSVDIDAGTSLREMYKNYSEDGQ